MNTRFSEITYPSADGKHTVYAEIHKPPEGVAVRGIVQLSHGMVDYVGRYHALAEALCAGGWIFAGNCHLGHGKTAGKDEDLGFFADQGGVELVLRDLHAMNRMLRASYPGLPLVVFGHSMGSFLARLYVEKYPHGVSGLIIHGTGGANPLVGFGKALGATVQFFRGARHRSCLISALAFGGYNRRFDKSEGSHAWLTRDTQALVPYRDDKYANFTFTVSAYRDLFRMVEACNSRAWFANYRKDLPTLIVSGDMDPVGNYGKGVEYVYKHLLLAGCSRVTLKMYPGARHELFNETNRQEVFSDILSWLNVTIA